MIQVVVVIMLPIPFDSSGTIYHLCRVVSARLCNLQKTGADVIGSFSKFASNYQNFAIFEQNLYNAIPMTLASLIYKYGQQAFA